MATLNQSTYSLFSNGGTLQIGATPDALVRIVKGSLKYKVPYYDSSIMFDQGVHVGTAIALDERSVTGSFELAITSVSLTGTGNVLASLMPAISAGAFVTYALIAKIPSGRGSSTGQQITFASCFCPEGYEYSQGDKYDKLSFNFVSMSNAVTYATY